MAGVFTRDVSPKFSSLVTTISLLFFLPFLLYGVYEVVTLISRATEKPAVITVNTKAILEPITTDFYHAFAQGGEEASDMIAPIRSQVAALKPKFIRIDHIYDYYNVVGRNGNELTFDFSRLDPVIDTILATGAKPVIALSYMPSVIARDGSVVNPPNNWDEWAIVVQKTIERYSGRSGKNIANIYYEVWNEPDLAQFGSWKTTGDKNYLTLYRYAAAGARQSINVNRFFLGGPSTTGLYQNWIAALAQSGLRVDFFSWHTYLADPKRYEQDQDNVIGWLTKINPELILKPRLITEFGYTGSKGTGYGTSYGAAHAAAVITKLAARGVTSLFSFQLKDGPGQEDGTGWGLLTHESNGSKPKPRYYIYGFLDSIAGTRLQTTGGNSFVSHLATTQGDVFRVVLVNFDSRGSHAETTTVTFTDLDPGSYSFRQKYFLGQDVTLKETVGETMLTKSIIMRPQSVVLLELKKLSGN